MRIKKLPRKHVHHTGVGEKESRQFHTVHTIKLKLIDKCNKKYKKRTSSLNHKVLTNEDYAAYAYKMKLA